MLKKNFLIEKLKKIKIGKLFYNNKFVMLFSLVASLITWIVISSSNNEVVPVTISDIPVNIQLSESAVQDGLRIFGGENLTARVNITGNRIVVGQVTKNDIQITAPQAASTIMSPGNYTLELSAKKVGVLQDYQIVSDVKPSVVTVMVDRYRESEFTIEPQINFTPKSDYYVGNTILSSPKVTLSGPEKEISKIKKVVVKADIPGEIDSPVTLKSPILLYDDYGQQITSETIKSSVNEVEVSVPVLMKKKVDLVANFSNLPSGFNLNKDLVKISPSSLEIAGPEKVVKSIKEIKLEEINFNEVNIQNNTFTCAVNLPEGCKSLNNTYSAEVNLNLSHFKEKTFNINDFDFKNVPNGKKASVYSGDLNVTVVGPAGKVNSLKPSDIYAKIEFEENKEFSGTMEMPVKLKINGVNQVWIYGKYFVNVNIE
ncbi:MAG: hypothetical protein IJJ04_00460 [Clostridia bacterium]|nr:hypothetical protein [Clostridia bacterium]